MDLVKHIADQLTVVENSKNITGVLYKGIESELYVRFNSGGIYLYKAVPLDLYLEFNSSASKGAFFHDRIKSKFECVKIENKTDAL